MALDGARSKKQTDARSGFIFRHFPLVHQCLNIFCATFFKSNHASQKLVKPVYFNTNLGLVNRGFISL